MLEITKKLWLPDDEISFAAARSSGPGGQNVNKVSTKAVLTWQFESNTSLPRDVKSRFRSKFSNQITKEGIVIIASDESRSLETNKRGCIEKLVKMLESVEKPPKKRIATKPSRAAKAQRMDAKKAHGDKKKGRSQKNWD